MPLVFDIGRWRALSAMVADPVHESSHPVFLSRREILQHYLADFVYGANDGIVTTFAVVAGVAGARLSYRVVVILGISNLLADGFSMGASNYLAIRSRTSAELHAAKLISEPYAARHALVTFVAFVSAGSLPLVTYVVPMVEQHGFAGAAIVAAMSLFGIGAARTLVSGGSWWRNGLEMLSIGGAAGAVSYVVGVWVNRWTAYGN